MGLAEGSQEIEFGKAFPLEHNLGKFFFCFEQSDKLDSRPHKWHIVSQGMLSWPGANRSDLSHWRHA